MFRSLIQLGKGACGGLNLQATTNTSSFGYGRHGLQVPSRPFAIWTNSIINPNLAKGKFEQKTKCPSHLMKDMSLRNVVAARSSFGCIWYQPRREFHAAGSKVHYMDFRHRLKVNHLRLHLLIIRRQKMKKHRRRKWRRKFKALIAKKRLKREISKEKTFRVELLSMIRKAENFDPREYALQKIAQINDAPKELTREEKLEKLKQLIRENRHQVDYIKPKHRKAEI